MTKTKRLDYGQDSPDVPTGTGELSQITHLAQLLVEADARVAEAARVMEAAEEARDRIAVKLLPDAMDACGQTSVGLADGRRVEISETIRASIPKEHSLVALKWLREKGQSALIKRMVTVTFGKGQDNRARAFYEDCMKENLEPSQKITVHPSTLSKFVRGHLLAGKDLPMDLLGVFRRREAEIMDPKAPKKRARRSEDDE